jgi:hypothetical protein
METVNPYDQVSYANRPMARTHPRHMAALARLHGVDVSPVADARVLELGTNQGGNLIPMAVSLPEAELTGIDLAAEPIQRGQDIIDCLSLKRIRLMAMNLMDVDESFGTFDYIIAHGLYAWTPPEVRNGILAVIRTNLSPNGVAFVSYDTNPGGHLKRILRDMMLFRANLFKDPHDRLGAARAILSLIDTGWPEPGIMEQAISSMAHNALEMEEGALYHDHLAEVFEPVYFRDFVEHAARHGLAYVADASVGDTFNFKLSSQAMDAVRASGGLGHIFQEQFLDLLRLRSFRSSMVCHAARAPTPGWDSSRAVGLFASGTASEGENAEFTSWNGRTIAVNEIAAPFLRELIALLPQSRPLEPGETEMALELYRRDLIELRVGPDPAVRASDRPLASPLVRLQLARGATQVTTLQHRVAELEHEDSRRLVTLLDGSRDLDELADSGPFSRSLLETHLRALERFALFLG